MSQLFLSCVFASWACLRCALVVFWLHVGYGMVVSYLQMSRVWRGGVLFVFWQCVRCAWVVYRLCLDCVSVVSRLLLSCVLVASWACL